MMPVGTIDLEVACGGVVIMDGLIKKCLEAQRRAFVPYSKRIKDFFDKWDGARIDKARLECWSTCASVDLDCFMTPKT